jgi:hypothetical protein
MLIVDPWHWLTEDGEVPVAPPRLRTNALRVARLIEYGSLLQPGVVLETLVECSKRPKRKACPGFLMVAKQADEAIHAICPVCRQDEILIRNWEETRWAMLKPFEAEPPSELPESARRRYERPYPASMDQVRITRKGEEAIIEYAEPHVFTTHIKFGPSVAQMSDEEILEWHNDMLVHGQEVAASYHHVAVEIPMGKPQLERVEHSEQSWVPRGGVLRCLVEDGGPNGEAVLFIDDRAFSAHDFSRMLTCWAGWGIRVLLVPDDELAENPDIEVREPMKDEG